MKSMITFIMLTSLPLQAMEQLENITVNLKNDQQISISPEQHKLLCRLSQTYADITQDTEKELGTTQIITLNNIPEESFSFIKKHLKQLSQLGNPTPQNDDKKAFETLKTDFNEQSDHRRKSIKQIVTYLDLPKTNFPPYWHGGYVHMEHCMEVEDIINQYIFNDPSQWPLITKITNDLISKNVRDLFKDKVSCLALSSDNSRLFSSSDDNAIKIWDLNTKRCIATLESDCQQVSCLKLSSDNSRLFSGSYDGTIKIWDLNTNSCIATLQAHDQVYRLALSSDNSRLFSGSHCGSIKIWDLETNRCIAILQVHYSEVYCLALSSDNRRLISCAPWNRTIKILDLETNRCIATLSHPIFDHAQHVCSLALSSDNSRLFSGSFEGTIEIWNLKTNRYIATLKGHDGLVICLALTPDNNRLISGSHDKTIKIWNLNTKRCIATLQGHCQRVCGLALSSDNSRLFSGSYDETIKIWDLNKFKEIKQKLNQLSICDVAILKIIQDKTTQREWHSDLCEKAKKIGASPALFELLRQWKVQTSNNKKEDKAPSSNNDA